MTVLLPVVKVLPFTAKVAPDAESGTLPRVVLPVEKITVPVGKALPLAALTVAVTTVAAEVAIVDGLAATEVLVATGGAVTVTVVEALEFEKFPVAV